MLLEKTRSRSKTKQTGKTKEDRKYLDRVASLGCIICGAPACIHHIREGQGMSQRASDRDVLPLCHNHHQGKEGIHTLGTRTWQKKFGTELELLERVKRLIA